MTVIQMEFETTLDELDSALHFDTKILTFNSEGQVKKDI